MHHSSRIMLGKAVFREPAAGQENCQPRHEPACKPLLVQLGPSDCCDGVVKETMIDLIAELQRNGDWPGIVMRTPAPKASQDSTDSGQATNSKPKKARKG